jgi:hypothetical protein
MSSTCLQKNARPVRRAGESVIGSRSPSALADGV